MVIDRFFANPNKLLELQFNGFFAVDPAKNIAEGSIFGHAASRGAMAVAATGAVENIDGVAEPGPRRHRGVQLARAVADLLHPDRRAGAGGPPQAEHHRGRRHLGDRRQLLHAVLRDLGVGAARGGASRCCSRTSIRASARPASRASFARRRWIAATPGFDTTWGFGLIDAFAAAKRAGQVGNSPLFWVCLPTRQGIQLVVPEFLIPAVARPRPRLRPLRLADRPGEVAAIARPRRSPVQLRLPSTAVATGPPASRRARRRP